MMTIVSARARPEELHRMCATAEVDIKNKAKENYSTEWEDQPHTLLWKFYNGGFKPCIGDYFLLYDDAKLAGGAGFYVYDDRYILGMTRFYVMPGWENKWIGQHIVWQQLQSAKHLGPKKMLITFNGYNKRIYDIYVNHIDKLPAIWALFKPVGEKEINHVMQFCCEADV